MSIIIHHATLDTDDDADFGECPRCGDLAPIGGDCPRPRCVAFRKWAAQHQDEEQTK